MSDDAPQFSAEWRRLASSGNERIKALAARLLAEPLALNFFPYSNHAGLHLSRNTQHPWDGAGLPWIMTDTADGSFVAVDRALEARKQGDLEEVVRAFIELLREAG